MKNMIHGRLLVFSALFMIAIFLAGCNSRTVHGLENVNLVISHFLPGNHPVHTDIFVEFGDRLQEVSDGRITYQIYPSNALGASGSQYDMAVTGEADLALSVHGYTNGRFPLVRVLELPFLTVSAEHGSRLITDLYEEFPAFQEEHSDTVPLWLFTADPAQIVSKDKYIERPEDMRGLRVRSPSPMGNDILEALGAVPVSMPMGDVYEALERGVIDAAMIPLEALYAYNLYEVSNHIVVGHFSSTPFYSVMHSATYHALTDEEREYLDRMRGVEFAVKSGQAWDISGDKGRELAEENQAVFIELEGELLEAWQEALEPVAQKWIQEIEEKGLPGQAIYERALELKEVIKAEMGQ